MTFNNAQNQVISVVYKNPVASTLVNTPFTAADIQIFPNPATESAIIRIAQPMTTNGHYTIYNPLGQIIKTGIITPESASNGLTLDCVNMPSGLYFFDYKSKTHKGNQRFMVNFER